MVKKTVEDAAVESHILSSIGAAAARFSIHHQR